MKMNYQNVILTIIALIAFLGNMLTVLLFLRNFKWLKKTYNCLIFALAIQDILLAICIMVLPGFVVKEDYYNVPAESEISRWIFCKIVWSQFIPFALGITSVYTCLMLTFDRWLAVVKPLSYKNYEQSRMVVILTILLPWFAGICFEITTPLGTTSSEVNGTVVCYWKTREYSSKTIFLAVFTFLGMIVIPAILMVVAYISIIVHIMRRRRSVFLSLKHITLTAFFASSVVIVCWLPDQFFYTLSQVQLTKLETSTHFVVKTLAFANSCFNPIIYCFSNSTYRRGLREMFGCFCCKLYPLVNEFSVAEHTTS